MRNLTIKKNKSRFNLFSKTRICIYDSESKDIRIKTKPYRILGTIKSNEEKTFQIDDNEIEIIAFNDKFSKDVANDVYIIPAGTNDVTLTGKDNNSIYRGTFEFDDNINEIALKNRKDQKKSYIILFVIILVNIIFVNLTTTPTETTFTVDEMQIILPDSFSDETNETYEMMAEELKLDNKDTESLKENLNDAYFYSDTVFLTVVKDSFEELTATGIQGAQYLSIEEYIEIVKAASLNEGKQFTDIKKENGATFCEHIFTGPKSEENLKYINFLYKTDNAFWIVSFATLEEEFENHRASFFAWEETIKFKESVNETSTQTDETEIYTEKYLDARSNIISISANGGTIYWQGNSKYEVETMNFGFQSSEKSISDALGNKYNFEVKQEGKQLTGWTVYEAEATDFLDRDIDGEGSNCILLGLGHDTIYYTYANMINPKLYSESLSTEELCNIEVNGSYKSYVAVANWK